mmetsp:Transcript_27350/g.40446  ORF Transcript_27350/g.40446 Transcript_27350/m.40446 type:complete len:287 (+) Transcript_27350:298-1158(+)
MNLIPQTKLIHLLLALLLLILVLSGAWDGYCISHLHSIHHGNVTHIQSTLLLLSKLLGIHPIILLLHHHHVNVIFLLHTVGVHVLLHTIGGVHIWLRHHHAHLVAISHHIISSHGLLHHHASHTIWLLLHHGIGAPSHIVSLHHHHGIGASAHIVCLHHHHGIITSAHVIRLLLLHRGDRISSHVHLVHHCLHAVHVVHAHCRINISHHCKVCPTLNWSVEHGHDLITVQLWFLLLNCLLHRWNLLLVLLRCRGRFCNIVVCINSKWVGGWLMLSVALASQITKHI